MLADVVFVGPRADKIVDLVLAGNGLLFGIWLTLVGYGVIHKNVKVGRYDTELVARNKKIMKWLGPLLIVLTICLIIYSIGVLIWP